MNKMVDGVLIAMTDAEIAEFNANLPTDAEILAQKWVSVRGERNMRLSLTCLLYTSDAADE